MGVLKKFEQRLEGLVNGTFAKVFKSEVQPVEIAGALQRECDNNATIWNRDRTVVPNDFIVELSTPDYERLSPYSGQLGDELAGMVRDYAKQQRYTFMGPIKVNLEKADDLDTGLYRVRSRTLASSTSGPQAPERAPMRRAATRRLRLPARGGRSAGRAPHASRTPARRPAPPRRVRLPARGRMVSAPRRAADSRAPRRPGPAPATGSRSTAPATRSPARRSCWAAAPRPTCGSTTPASPMRHCEIRTGTPSTIQDLGSTNGIVVDGQHTTRATLRDGSRIVVGNTTIIYRQAEG